MRTAQKNARLHARNTGFTLIELLVVIAIISVLAIIILASLSSSRQSAYLGRTKEEFHSVATALEFYANDHGGSYPADADRSVPPGLERYLANGTWPPAPWQNSVYDWDAWGPTDLTYPPFQQVYQISVRFCPSGQPSNCTFPNETWARNFDYYSSVYFCISGPCRAHSSQPTDHAAYCINC